MVILVIVELRSTVVLWQVTSSSVSWLRHVGMIQCTLNVEIEVTEGHGLCASLRHPPNLTNLHEAKRSKWNF